MAGSPPAPGAATQERIDRALAAVRSDGDRGDAWARLGEALVQRARESESSGDVELAEAAFRLAHERAPGDVAALVGLGWVAGHRHDFAASRAWAERALALDPEEARAHGLLGDAAVELGDYDAAFEHVQRMLDLRPDLGSYSRAAHLLFVTGDASRAFSLMRRAIAAGAPHAENTAWCRARLAAMFWATGAVLPAQQLVAEGLAATPEHHDLLMVGSRIALGRGDRDGARALLERARVVHDDLEVRVALGELALLEERPEDAQRHFARAEALHAEAAARGKADGFAMARFWADHGRRLPDALREARAAYQRAPDVFAADLLGWAEYRNGRPERALERAHEALRHDTPDPAMHFHAGLAHAALGQDEAARRHLQHALALNPAFHPLQAPEAEAALRRLVRRSGREGRPAGPVKPPS